MEHAGFAYGKPPIIIVEDDDAVRASLVTLAELRGWNVTAFASALEFLDWSEEAEVRPACLVIDLQMPEMNGAELAEWLQSHNRNIPTLALTAWPDGDLAHRASSAGVSKVMSKPITPSEWIRAVEQVCTLQPGPRMQ